jgi:catechol 2,3-dioxygenase-like lactoylglutathione lyase family enzyme
MKLAHLDHLVLTVRDLERSVDFYTSILGMEKSISPQGRISLRYGSQKINLHRAGAEFQPCARHPGSGSADLCFITVQPLAEVVDELKHKNVTIIEGPVERTGAAGTITSVYVRDPDGNLLELSNYQ